MIVARWIFLVAGIIGLFEVVLTLMLGERFYEGVPVQYRLHPEFFYGFIGVTFAWQVAFVLIGLEPVRLRPVMIAAILEKFLFVIAILWLYIAGRLESMALIFGGIDLIFGILFVLSWLITPDTEGGEVEQGYAPE
jgi:hypothetical protein